MCRNIHNWSTIYFTIYSDVRCFYDNTSSSDADLWQFLYLYYLIYVTYTKFIDEFRTLAAHNIYMDCLCLFCMAFFLAMYQLSNHLNQNQYSGLGLKLVSHLNYILKTAIRQLHGAPNAGTPKVVAPLCIVVKTKLYIKYNGSYSHVAIVKFIGIL